jgi:hypothetical protein
VLSMDSEKAEAVLPRLDQWAAKLSTVA